MSSREKVRAFYERHPYPPPVDSLESYRRLWQDRQRRRADYHLSWPARPYREDHVDPDRRLRDLAGGQARPALARGAGDRHRLQRDQRPPHRGAQAKVRPRQPRGPPARRRARRRAGRDVRSDRLHRRPPSPRRSRRGAARRCATCSRPDGAMHLMVYAPLRADRRLHAAGVLPAGRHRGHRRRDSGARRRARRAAARASAGDAAARGAGLPGRRRRSPMRCCTRRTAPTRCRSCSSSSRAAGLTFGRWVQQAPYSPRCGVMARLPQARAARRSFRRRSSTPPSSCSGARWFATASIAYRDDGRGAARTAQLRRRRLARLRADPHARHDLRRGAAAAGRGRGADQPRATPTPTSTCRSTRGRSASSTPSTATRTIARDRADRRGSSRRRAPSSSGSTATTRSPSTRPRARPRLEEPPRARPSPRRLEEEEGFEPPALSRYGFQDRRLRPLGHSSGC